MRHYVIEQPRYTSTPRSIEAYVRAVTRSFAHNPYGRLDSRVVNLHDYSQDLTMPFGIITLAAILVASVIAAMSTVLWRLIASGYRLIQADYSGLMFALVRKKLSGSYFFFSCTRRSYVAGL